MPTRLVSFLLVFSITVFGSCKTSRQTGHGQTFHVSFESLQLFDSSRNRQIPVAYYKPQTDKPRLIIFSHGYGQNKANSYLDYSYLTQYLATKGYFVASIQHELPNDSLIPNSGIPQVVRLPFWNRGADNINFVIKELKKRYQDLDFKQITLIGHSNGGDMTALFPKKYPAVASKIITLDNRRMALPQDKTLKVYSLRSSDQPADPGVIPNPDQQKEYGITIVKLDIAHNDMDNKATQKQQDEIRHFVLRFLAE